MDGEKYRNMLIHYGFTRFATLRQDYIFKQDGAPEHYLSRVKNCLDNTMAKELDREGRIC